MNLHLSVIFIFCSIHLLCYFLKILGEDRGLFLSTMWLVGLDLCFFFCCICMLHLNNKQRLGISIDFKLRLSSIMALICFRFPLVYGAYLCCIMAKHQPLPHCNSRFTKGVENFQIINCVNINFSYPIIWKAISLHFE